MIDLGSIGQAIGNIGAGVKDTVHTMQGKDKEKKPEAAPAPQPQTGIPPVGTVDNAAGQAAGISITGGAPPPTAAPEQAAAVPAPVAVPSDARLKRVSHDINERILKWEADYGKYREEESNYSKLRDFLHTVVPQTYNYKKGTGEDPEVEHTSPMANDLKKVFPDAVSEERPYTVDTGRLALDLTGVVSELGRLTLSLEKQIKAMKGAK